MPLNGTFTARIYDRVGTDITPQSGADPTNPNRIFYSGYGFKAGQVGVNIFGPESVEIPDTNSISLTQGQTQRVLIGALWVREYDDNAIATNPSNEFNEGNGIAWMGPGEGRLNGGAPNALRFKIDYTLNIGGESRTETFTIVPNPIPGRYNDNGTSDSAPPDSSLPKDTFVVDYEIPADSREIQLADGTRLRLDLERTVVTDNALDTFVGEFVAEAPLIYAGVTLLDVPDDFPDDSSTTASLAAGTPRTGNIESEGDADWFKVQLTAGNTYTVALRGAATAAGTLDDPHVYLYNASGQLVAEDDDTGDGFDSLLTYRPTASGTYFVAAREHNDDATGTYRLALNAFAPPRPTTGNDNLTGTPGNDVIDALAGDDTVDALAGDDRVSGSAGRDTLLGRGGFDTLGGGKDKDTLTGGTEADIFDFNAAGDSGPGSTKRDVITDFNQAEGDVIDLATIDAKTTTGGNQAFTFIGSSPLSAPGQIRANDLGSTVVLQANVNANKAADLEIEVRNFTGSFVASNFVL